MAYQLFLDLYDCNKNKIDDLELVTEIAHKSISDIGAYIVEECSHKFSPIGITYIAVISTSHFSIHTWPEYGYAAIDIFSCDKKVPDSIGEFLKNAFEAKSIKQNRFNRDIKGGAECGI